MLMLVGGGGRVGDPPLLLGGGAYSDGVRVLSFVLVASRFGTDPPDQRPPELKACLHDANVSYFLYVFFRFFHVLQKFVCIN